MQKKRVGLAILAGILAAVLTGCIPVPVPRALRRLAESEPGAASSSAVEIDTQDMLRAMEEARVGELQYLEEATVQLDGGIMANIYMPVGYRMDDERVLLGSAQDVEISARQGEVGDDYQQAFMDHYEDVKSRVLDAGFTVEYESHYFSHPDGIAHLRTFAGYTDEGKMYSSTQCVFYYSDLATMQATVLWYAVWTDETNAQGNGAVILEEVERSMDLQIPAEVLDWVV